MKDLHFCTVPPDEVPLAVPRTVQGKDNFDYSLVGAWMYQASGQTPMLMKVRYDGPDDPETGKPKKGMRWYRLEADGEWVVGLNEQAVPLYGVESIRDGDPCVVCEGEKSASALHSIGVAAVAFAGTGAAGTVDLSPLKGVELMLWPDNDSKGREAMDTIANRLGRGHKRIDPVLLGLPEKGDAADFVAAGDIADAAAFLDRVGLALSTIDGPPSLLEALPIGWLEAGAPERPFVFMGGRIPAGCVTLLSAAGGSGKSIILLLLAVSVCLGRNLLKDWQPMQRGRVVMVSVEDDLGEVTRRLLRIFRAFGLGTSEAELVQENLRLLCRTTFGLVRVSRDKLEAHPDLVGLGEELAKAPPLLLTVDPLAAVLSGLDENDNPTAQAVVGLLRENVPVETGVILATHTSKAERLTGTSARGAGGWSDAARQAWSLRPLDNKEAAQVKQAGDVPGMYVCLQHLKSNYGPMHGESYFRRSAERGCGGVLESVNFGAMEEAQEKRGRAALIDAVLQLLGEFEPITRTEATGKSGSPEGKRRGAAFRERLTDMTGQKVSIRTLEPILEDLVKDKRVVSETSPGHRAVLHVRPVQGELTMGQPTAEEDPGTK